MPHETWSHLAVVGVGLAGLAGFTVALARATGVGVGWLPAYAIVRAIVQLSLIALALRGILTHPVLVTLFILVMLTSASITASRRVAGLWHARRAAVTAVITSSTLATGAVFAFGLVPHGVRYLIAVAGILIGNAMTAVTLAGRNYRRQAYAERDQIEGWLALGATPQRATREAVRVAVREAMIPTLDQTKATGIVTLPGAFVGALFGGLDPVGAAVFQLVVLAAVALVMLVAGLVLTTWVGRAPVLPAAP